MTPKPTLDDVVLANADEAERDCAVCGESIEEGARVVWVPDWASGPPSAITLVHLHCAVEGDEIELTGIVP